MNGRPVYTGEQRPGALTELFDRASDNRPPPGSERRAMGYRRRDWVAIVGEADHQDVLRKLLDQQGRHNLASLVSEPAHSQDPMAIAVAAFALPLSVPAVALWRPRAWWPLVHWRIAVAVFASLAIGVVLFAWRTWYYTGVFSFFHGTQREHLAVWKPGMPAAAVVESMVSSLMMVLTASDPPHLAWHSAPLPAAAAIAILALLGAPGFRTAPLALVLFFLAGCSSALVTRGWAYEGRFSIHLFGAAGALCAWGISAIARLWYSPAHPLEKVTS